MTLLELKLEPLSPEQLSQVVELDRITLGGLWSIAGYQRELNSPNSSLLTLAVGENVVGIGCLWAVLEEAHITIVAVHPDYQGQGFGQLLVYSLLKEARSRKLERATLEVRESNQVAIYLYKKFGFQEAGRRKKYYKQTNEDALILWRGGLNRAEFTENMAHWQEMLRKSLDLNGWKLILGQS